MNACKIFFPFCLIMVAISTGSCAAKPVKSGDPLFNHVSSERYLAYPISSREHGIRNIFGPLPIMPTGTKVQIFEILKKSSTYYIHFTGPKECEPHCLMVFHDDGNGIRANVEYFFKKNNPLNSLDEITANHISSHVVAVGMDPETVSLSLGKPDRIEIVDRLGSPAEKWVYMSSAILEDGSLSRKPGFSVVFITGRIIDYEDLRKSNGQDD